MPPSYGGPFAGVIATREKFVRQMPGRLAGQTTDTAGRRGFCLTLATREQHIRREAPRPTFAPTRRSARWPPPFIFACSASKV